MSEFRRALREVLVQGRTRTGPVQGQRRAEADEWENAFRKLRERGRALSQQVESIVGEARKLREQYDNLTKEVPRHLGGGKPPRYIQAEAAAYRKNTDKAIGFLADGAEELF